jgi:hypothetical protein
MRIMAEDNLLAVQPKSFVVTTNSDHEFEVYLNLASRMKLTGINQLWIADITYIRLQREFVSGPPAPYSRPPPYYVVVICGQGAHQLLLHRATCPAAVLSTIVM